MRSAILLVAVLGAVVIIAGCPTKSDEMIAANKAAYDMDIKALEEGAVIWEGEDSSGLGLWKIELRVAALPTTLPEVRDESAYVQVRACFVQISGETDWDVVTNPTFYPMNGRYTANTTTSRGTGVYSWVEAPTTLGWRKTSNLSGPPSGRTRYFNPLIVATEYPSSEKLGSEPAPELPAKKAEKE